MTDYREILEDSYDDYEEEGYKDYGVGAEGQFSINDSARDDDDMKSDEMSDEEYEEMAITEDEQNSSEWHIYGLDKTYKGEFELERAIKLFSSEDIDEQKEAIRYATYYAARRNFEAQDFIVMAIQMKDIVNESVHQLALTSFILFFRNFLRTQCQKYYARMDFPSDGARLERTIEAVAECQLMALEEIYNYDRTKGFKLTTFYETRIRGCIASFEAKLRGRASKQTMGIDKKVSKVEVSLKARGITPTARRIALELGDQNVERIYNSTARIEAENTMISIDVDETKTGIINKVAQNKFDSPEGAMVRGESNAELFEVLSGLSDVERQVLLAMNNMTIEGGQLMDVVESEMGDIYSVARNLGMKSGEVKRIYSNVITKIKGEYGVKSGNDRLLEGRSMIFADDTKDREVDSFLEEITAIF